MNEFTDPPRLFESADNALLREGLRDMASEIASVEQLASLESSLTAQVAGTAAKLAAPSIGVGKIVLSAALGTSLLVGGTYASMSVRKTTPAAKPEMELYAPAPMPAPPVVPLPPAPSLPAAPAAKASPAAVHVASESELLGQAQDALAAAPARALRLCDLHQKSYPDGMLSQERDVVAIDALMRLHEPHKAAARARSFLKAHPESTYGLRIRQIVGESLEELPTD